MSEPLTEYAGLVLLGICFIVGVTLLLVALFANPHRRREPRVPRLGPDPSPLNLTRRNAAAIRYGIELGHKRPRTEAFDKRLEHELLPLTRTAYHRTRAGLVARTYNRNHPDTFYTSRTPPPPGPPPRPRARD